MRPDFQTQYNKIVKAYMKDKLNPLNQHFCFVGNLFDNDGRWVYYREMFLHDLNRNRASTKDELATRQLLCGNNDNNVYNNNIIERFTNQYSLEEITLLEQTFLITIAGGNNLYSDIYNKTYNTFSNVGHRSMYSIMCNMSPTIKEIELYEERLYQAMEKTLLLLKEIHEGYGEEISTYEFKKREIEIIENT